jgi:hypothetical protein
MKHALILSALILATPALAAEKTLRFDDAGTYFPAGIGRQVTLVFAPGMVSKYFPNTTYGNVTLSDLPDGQVCFYSTESGLDPADAKFKDIARKDQNDMCVARADVSVKYDAQEIAGATPQPFFQTDAQNCKWSWKTGKGIGLWAEDCKFESGSFVVTYDAGKDAFMLGADGSDAYAVVRQFYKKAEEGPDALLPDFKAKGLIPNDDECRFAPSDVVKPFGAWQIFEILPTGKRKETFDAAPSDEIPEPPCGQIGEAVDSLAYFMIDQRHPDRVLYLDLGQDTPLFDPTSISLF